MTTKTILASAISTALLSTALPSHASTVTDFIKDGDVITELRIRNENVQQDNTIDDAIAMTARARLGFETPSMAGFKVLAEFDQVVVLQDEYDSKSTAAPNNTNKSIIADGMGSDFNRFQISYDQKIAEGTKVGAVLGRQRIILDNARFVGNVGWRQNEQTFDAARVDFSTLENNLLATYAYINQVNDIFYNDTEVNHHLLNIGYKTPVGKITGYSYLLEDDDSEATNDTYGLRFNGKTALDSLSILYTAEYADQTGNDGTTGAKDNDAQYSLLEAGIEVSGITVAAGMESLGGDGTYAFQTPLATKHAFNGWADSFLGTGDNGLQDTYAKVSTKLAGVKLLAVYHDYSSDKNNDNLGDEINLLASKKFDDNFSAGVKFAQYSAGDATSGKVDTDKLWLWAEAKF